jgi:hypothetical protein
MGRIVMGTISLAIVAYLGYRSMGGHLGAEGTPKQRLDNVHTAADRIEKNDQKAADDALKKGAEP